MQRPTMLIVRLTMEVGPVKSLGVLLAVCSCGTLAAAEPPRVYTLEPPAAVQADLDRIRTGQHHVRAIKALAARDDAAPYLRLALATARGPYKGGVEAALEVIDARAYARNLTRARAWLAGRRLDLYTEFLSGCREADAVELADRLAAVGKQIADEALGDDNKIRIPHFGKSNGGFSHNYGDDVTAPEPVNAVPVLLRAGTAGIEAWDRWVYFVAVRGEVREVQTPPKKRLITPGKWTDSAVFTNARFQLAYCELSLIVCADDIELIDRVDRSLVIAGGNIKAGKNYYPSVDRSVLCAAGDISHVPPQRGSRLYAGGVVTFREPVAPDERVKEKQADPLFGVQFLRPEEFRMEVAAQNGGVQVMKIAADSPFARYGVEDADVITAANGVDTPTVAAFRRELRRGVVAESMALTIRRGTERLTRIVFLDGVPPPIAPAPRPKP